MPTFSVASFAFALALVFGDIHVSASSRRSNAFTIAATISCSCVFADAGKYFATYICATTSPSAPLVALTARFQRSCCWGVPDSVLP